MRSSLKTLVAAVAALLVVPQFATAEDVQEQLRKMQERMKQLEDSLQATNDQLEQANRRVSEQQQIMERAGLDDERSAISALSKFLSRTEFSGLVAASYNWNFANPDNNLNFAAGRPATTAGENTGSLGVTAPFHRAHNSFQLDQALFSMVKPATSDSRAGFGVDLLFGVSADNRRVAGTGVGNTGDLSHLHQAYLSYLAPLAIGNGVLVTAGRFETMVGAEVLRQDENFNVTRGLVWSLQPVHHTGVLATSELGGGFSGGLGVVNNVFGGTGIDTDSVKTAVGQVGWADDRASVAVTGFLGFGDTHQALTGGQAAASDEGLLSIVDLVATVDPSENLSLWLNFDWIHNSDDGLPTWNVYAVAAAGRLALSEQTGASTRLEYVRGTEICPALAAAGGCGGASVGGDDIQLISITLTLDHSLTENLMLRGEYRYDFAEADGSSTDSFFVGETDMGKDNQHLALVEMVYSF